MLRCAQQALAANDVIDQPALRQCLIAAGIDPDKTQIPAVGG